MEKKMNKDNVSWTNEEIQTLLRMKTNGFPYAHIAGILGRSNDACRKKIQVLNKNYRDESKIVPEILKTVSSKLYRSWTLEDLRMLYDLRQQGLPFSLIAQELNRTEQSCSTKYRVVDWSAIVQETDEEKYAQKETV
jgi:hypothetical protein